VDKLCREDNTVQWAERFAQALGEARLVVFRRVSATDALARQFGLFGGPVHSMSLLRVLLSVFGRVSSVCCPP
jgi:hypothetical protein